MKSTPLANASLGILPYTSGKAPLTILPLYKRELPHHSRSSQGCGRCGSAALPANNGGNIQYSVSLITITYKLETEHGQRVELRVLTTLNFQTTPSFSVTTPGCKPRLIQSDPSKAGQHHPDLQVALPPVNVRFVLPISMELLPNCF